MKNILIVEDDDEIVKLLTLHFQQLEICLSSCANGITALEKVKKENYHLVILDINLPDMNGIEVCRRLRIENKFVP
ncbi:MAG: response regulator, partial [Chitinophagaceae bacterium]